MSNCFRLSKKSLKNLKGVHNDLVRVVVRAIQISETDFGVREGLRNLERQKMLVATGKSQTMNSRHLTGEAVDLWLYPLDWSDWDRWNQMARAMKDAAIELGVEIEWGGDWKSFKDGPHFQLKRK